jgi:hypothetical protein
MQNDIGYISHEELVFSPEKNIQSGGFSVSSIMMKAGLSPIMTMNVNTDNIGQNGGSNKVSDLFQNLAVPNWATMYTMKGGEYKEQEQEKDKKKQEKDKKKQEKDKKEGDSDSDSDSDIDDDLHDKLLDLVKEHENITKKKNNKSKRTDKKEKKNITKKNKKQKKEER